MAVSMSHVTRRLAGQSTRLASHRVHLPPAHKRALHPDVLDPLRVHLKRIRRQDHEIGQFSGLQRPLGLLLKTGECRVDGEATQRLLGRQSLLRGVDLAFGASPRHQALDPQQRISGADR